MVNPVSILAAAQINRTVIQHVHLIATITVAQMWYSKTQMACGIVVETTTTIHPPVEIQLTTLFLHRLQETCQLIP